MRVMMLVVITTCTAAAQFLPPLQSETPEEYDAYLDVLEPGDAQQTFESAVRFERQWPKSSLLAHVYQLQFEAATSLGKVEEAVAAGKRALALAPNNLTVRASLAVILANQAHDPAQVEAADREAAETIRALESFRPPKSLPYMKWLQAERRVRSQASVALALVAFKRDKLEEAVQKLEAAVSLDPAPATQYRLGKLYAHLGRLDQARKMLLSASAGGDAAIRALAEKDLRELQ